MPRFHGEDSVVAPTLVACAAKRLGSNSRTWALPSFTAWRSRSTAEAFDARGDVAVCQRRTLRVPGRTSDVLDGRRVLVVRRPGVGLVPSATAWAEWAVRVDVIGGSAGHYVRG